MTDQLKPYRITVPIRRFSVVEQTGSVSCGWDTLRHPPSVAEARAFLAGILGAYAEDHEWDGLGRVDDVRSTPAELLWDQATIKEGAWDR